MHSRRVMAATFVTALFITLVTAPNTAAARGCTPENAHNCRQHPGIEVMMAHCLAGELAGEELVGSPPGPTLYLTCSGYKHIVRRHHADEAPRDFLKCLAKVNTKSKKTYDGNKYPHKRKAWKNPRTGVTGNIVFDPVANDRIVTAYTSGKGGDNWKGCAK